MKPEKFTSFLTTEVIAHLLLTTAQFVFSGWHIVAHTVMQYTVDPIVFIIYRELFAAVVMYVMLDCRGVELRIEKADYWRFFALGFCHFMSATFSIIALTYIAATRFAIFQPLVPCITSVVSTLLGQEKMTVVKAVGIVLAVSGALIVVHNKAPGVAAHQTVEKNMSLGTFFVTVQILMKSAILIMQKNLLLKYDSTLATLVYTGVGCGFAVLASVATHTKYTAEMFAFDFQTGPWLGLGYATLFVCVFGHNCVSWGGKYLSPSTLSVYSTLQPVSTIALSFLLLGIAISVPELLGATLVISGLFVTMLAPALERRAGCAPISDEKRNSDMATVITA